MWVIFSEEEMKGLVAEKLSASMPVEVKRFFFYMDREEFFAEVQCDAFRQPKPDHVQQGEN